MAYNGYTNKETWLVNLWLSENLDTMAGTSEGVTPEDIEDLVAELIDEQVDQYGFVRDLMQCAVAEVNFAEIAKHYQTEEA